MFDRYETYRKLAITKPSDLVKGKDYYVCYCLGYRSFITVITVIDNTINNLDDIGPTILVLNHGHGYIDEMGMGSNNCNQHLTFETQELAEQYKQACMNDLNECIKQKQLDEEMDEFERIYDKYNFPDY